MKFGIAVTNAVNPAVTPESQAEYVAKVAEATEQYGYDSIWVADRTVYPVDIMQRYPHMFGPHHSKPESQNLLEALTVLSYVAGRTKRLTLGMAVLCLPFRHPVLNAKMITSIDALSGGRVIFGVGTGWMREEFEGMYAKMEERGSVTDEHIEMFKALCTQDVAEYKGKHFQISGQTFFPKPVQKPHPPIWIGGKTDAALRRVARLGQGWNGILLSPEEIAELRKRLEQHLSDKGRKLSDVKTALTQNVYWGEAKKTANGARLSLTGSTDELVDDLRAYEQAGLDHLIMSMSASDTKGTVEQLKRFASDVLSKVK